MVLGIGGPVNSGVEPAEFFIGEELGETAGTRRTGEGELFTGEFTGFDEVL